MRDIPLHTLIETAASQPDEKHLTGNVTDFNTLTKVATLKSLDDQHAGVFAFLAFHPVVDRTVSEYVDEGTLPDDSGPKVLVLFTMDQHARWQTKKHLIEIPGIQIADDEHPAYRMIRLVFSATHSPPLPGLLLFNRFVGNKSAVYVDLAALSKDQVRQRLRAVFELATQANKPGTSDFAARLGTLLGSRGIAYVKNEAISLPEWLAKAWRELRDKKYELLALVH